jgi:cell division protein FtsB
MAMAQRAAGAGSWSLAWKTGILAVALLVNLTLGIRLFWGYQSLSNYHHLKKQQAALQADLALQDMVNAGLSREIRLLQNDGRYLEKKIRQRLNYVKEHEILYLFNGGQNATIMGAAGHEGKN